MAEYIGSRISLVSKSDIRYVGTLHEINSNDATVALENVSSFGTEGRKENPEDEIPASTNVYEYIVFRGSDVKDLRIEEVSSVKENKPLGPPDDPAILQGHSRPAPHAQPPQRQVQNPPQGPQNPQQIQSPQGALPFAHHPQYPPPFYPPPPAGWGRGGPPGPGNYPPMPYGAPPGWYPGPGQGFPPGPFPYGYPPGPPGPFQHGPQPQQQPPHKPSPIGPSGSKQTPPAIQPTEKPTAPKDLPKPIEAAISSAQKARTPPVASKSSPTEFEAAVAQVPAAPRAATQSAHNNAGRIFPAVPRQGHATATSPQPIVPKQIPAAPGSSLDPSAKLTAATQAATAAVAAAMAKLPPATQSNGNALDDLTNKVNQMRTTDRVVRAPAQPGRGAGFSRGGRGGRGGFRGPQAAPAVELPGSDFDFDSANAKFNKQDLVKEAIAGSPLAESSPAASPTDPDIPVSGYNKSTSFFDNISSESKDRMEGSNSKAGGREWRGEEQKKNVETFGQGSVDNGYRGGYRGGRGRGRGRGGYRGRGYSGNGQPRGSSNYRGRDAEASA